MNFRPFNDEDVNVHNLRIGKEYEPTLSQSSVMNTQANEFVSIEKAEIHKAATRISKLIPQDKARSGEYKVCECCGLAISEKFISILSPLKKFYHLGPSIPLYLDYVFNANIFLLIMILFYGLYSLLAYSGGKNCKPSNIDCPRTFLNYYSLANILDDPVHSGHWVQDILMVVVLVGLILYSNIVAFKHEKIATDIDLMNDTPADYTIRITGLPLDEDHEIIERNLNKIFDGYGLDIVKVVVVHDIKKHIKTIRKWKKLETEIQEDLTDETKKEYDQVFTKMKTLFDKGKLKVKLTGNAFLILNKQYQVELLLQNENMNWFQKIFGKSVVHHEKDGQVYALPNHFYYYGKRLYLTQAPEPSDVFWENLSVSVWKRLPNLIITFLVSVTIISVTVIILFTLNKQQIINERQELLIEKAEKIYEEDDFDMNKLQRKLIPIIVAALNIVVRLILKVLVSFERPQTYTEYMLDATIWQTIVKFVTSVIVIIMVTLVSTVRQPLFMINNLMVNIMIVNALLPSVLNLLLDPDYLIHVGKKLYGNYLLKKKKITQQKLNELYEYPELDLIDRYSTIYLVLLLSCAFAPVAPLCLIIGFGGNILTYLVDKIIITRRSSISKDLSGHLSFIMTLRFDVCIVVLVISEWFWDKKFVDGINGYKQPLLIYYMIITIVVLYILTPMKWLLKDFAISRKKKMSQITYFEMQRNFNDDYDQKNPASCLVNIQRAVTEDESNENFQKVVEYAQNFDLTESIRKSKTMEPKKRKMDAFKSSKSMAVIQQNSAFRRLFEADSIGFRNIIGNHKIINHSN